METLDFKTIPWIKNLPQNWEVKPTKYLIQKIKEIIPYYNDEKVISLSMTGVHERDLDAGGKMPKSFAGYQKIEPGNLLMCLFDIDVTPRCVGVVHDEGITSPAYSRFEMKSDADVEYYYYFFLILDTTKELVYFSKNLRFSLTEDEIGKIKVIHPPLEEQKKIADFLDDKCAQIDEITKDLEEKINKLDEYKKEIVFEAVTKGLNPQTELKDSGVYWIGNVPSHWKVVKGKYCFDNDKEIVGARVDQYERLALTLNGVIKRSKDDNEGLQPKDFATYQILRKDELVFKLIDLQNISTSRVGLSPYVGLVSPAYIILKSRKNTYPSYAERFYLMMWYNQIFNHLGDDGVRSSLNASELLNLPFVLPPLEEQKKIADFLDDKCAQIDEITKATREEIETLKQYKQSLIYEYVTGKKEVPNE